MSEVVELEYVEERGPGIAELPESSERPPEVDGQAAVLPVYPGWEREQVDQFLKGTGAGIHFMIGAAENDWKMTEEDLERMGAPLTRIANRWEPALRLSPIADPLLFGHGAFLYAWRSMLERQRALYDKQDQEEREAPGYERAQSNGNGEPDHQAPDVDEENPRTYFPQGADDDE
jgi:hypothetical protein